MPNLQISNNNPNLLQVSSNGRYLLNNGSPWLLIGDSPQGLMSDLTPAQMETYMADREGRGINCIQVHLLSGATFGGNSTTFAAQDGTTPFTTTGDISTLREAYFLQVDAMLNLAASHEMVVILTAGENIDAATLLKNNGTTKCTNFGTFLGNRYKNFPNIVWDYGNDYAPGEDTSLDDCLLAMCTGIKSADPNHLQTLWGDYYLSSSRDDTDWDNKIDIDFGYSYYPTYDIILDEYAKSPAKPVYYGEGNYEGEDVNPTHYTTLPIHLRKAQYWTMLSGGCGFFYCNGQDTWCFQSGWETRLSTTGVNEIAHLKSLFTAYSWWNLVPDTAHNVLTAGYGTYANGTDGSIDTNNYATCAWITDGSLAIIYMPANLTLTVDMSKFSNTVTCRWYDPTSGQYETDAASPHANSGSHDFSHSGTNDAGAADWVLVLEVV